MKDIVHRSATIPATTPEAAEKIRALTESINKELVKIEFVTEHLLHGGMYTRTVRLPADAVCTAVLIKPSTVLITAGDIDIWSNDELMHVQGYNVFPGMAGRKIAFVTRSVVAMSMVMSCEADTVDEAQREFTDEFELLPSLSDTARHRTVITGE